MFELSEIFESQITTNAFIIGSIAFIVFNVVIGTSLVLMRESSRPRSLPRATQMQIAGALVTVAAVLAAGVGVGINPLISHRKAAAIAAPANAISIEELHRHIDMKALPVQAIMDFM